MYAYGELRVQHTCHTQLRVLLQVQLATGTAASTAAHTFLVQDGVYATGRMDGNHAGLCLLQDVPD
jgi:hypothetical protein